MQAVFQMCLSLCCNCLEMYSEDFIVVVNYVKLVTMQLFTAKVIPP